MSAPAAVRTGPGAKPDEPLKLLEVNRSTVPAGIMPVYFGASRDFPLPVVIVELTEEEFRAVQDGVLVLPEGWDEPRVLHQHAA